MAHELKIPEVGESVREIHVGQWLVQEGQWVERDENLVELESDKASVELPAPANGYVSEIKLKDGDTAEPGDVIGLFEESDEPPEEAKAAAQKDEKAAEAEAGKEPAEHAQRAEVEKEGEKPPKQKSAKPAAKAEKPSDGRKPRQREEREAEAEEAEPVVMPSAKRLLAEHGITPDEIEPTGPGGRLLKEDVLRYLEQIEKTPVEQVTARETAGREEETVPMSLIRRRIAQRLVEAQQTAALLTTFNEIDLGEVIELRKHYQEEFQQKHGVKLGFMSFFVKASIEALKQFPAVNAEIRESNIVYRNYYDIGIAIGGGKGLVVPILRNAERMSFAEIEEQIRDFAKRAQANKLKPDELEGGTFTITNGGVYGSLLSTPIVNPPQSGILGMHAIQERPVAIDGEVVIRPMMYVALTYDHRIVDGREAVTFLRHIKELVEDPSRILLEI